MPRSSHAAFEAARGPRSDRHPPGRRRPTGSPTCCRCATDVWPSPLRLLPGHARRHGLRPGRHATHGDRGAGQRRCPPLQFRPVRLARSASSSSTPMTSTRRYRRPWEWDVKRLAGERHRGRSRQRLHGRGQSCGGDGDGALVSRLDETLFADAPHRRVVLGTSRKPTSGLSSWPLRSGRSDAASQACQGRCHLRQGPGTGRPQGRSVADDGRRWSPRHQGGTTDAAAGRDPRWRSRPCGGLRRLPRHDAARACASSWSATASPTSRSRSWASGSVGTRCFVVVLAGSR